MEKSLIMSEPALKCENNNSFKHKGFLERAQF